MTDFQFLSTDGTLNVTFRTDFIGNATQGGNLTICQFTGLSTDTNHLFVMWQKVKYTIYDLITFATTNSLKLIATSVGDDKNADQEDANTVLNAVVLAAPGTFAVAVNSATQITLTWVKTPHATGYSIDRSTSSTFASGVTNTLVGDVATLVVTGLTTGTHYYFRIKATAVNATTSAYSLANGTTS